MTGVIAIPWDMAAAAILECGHAVPLSPAAARYYGRERTLRTGWMTHTEELWPTPVHVFVRMRCPVDGELYRVTDVIVRHD